METQLSALETLKNIVGDAIKPIEVTVGGIGQKVEELGQKVETISTELEVIKQMPARELPIAQVGISDRSKSFFGYDLTKQCREVRGRGGEIIKLNWPDEKREKIAKYLLLSFLSVNRPHSPAHPEAVRMFYEDFGAVVKADVGDTGNVLPIPDIVEAEILHYAREKSTLLKYARIWPMTSDKKSIPREQTEASVSWGNTTPESDLDLDAELELDTQELSAYKSVRNDTLEDTVSDVAGWLLDALSTAIGQELDNQAFNGTGDPCSGLLTAACGKSVVLASGSTAFSNITATQLSSMIAKISGLRKVGARFFLHGEVLHYIRDLKDDNSRPIFVTTIGDTVSSNIWGYPYDEVPKMVSTSAANTAFIIFGNLANFAVGRRLANMTLDVDPYGLWTTNRTRFKVRNRWALAIALKDAFCRVLTAAS